MAEAARKTTDTENRFWATIPCPACGSRWYHERLPDDVCADCGKSLGIEKPPEPTESAQHLTKLEADMANRCPECGWKGPSERQVKQHIKDEHYKGGKRGGRRELRRRIEMRLGRLQRAFEAENIPKARLILKELKELAGRIT